MQRERILIVDDDEDVLGSLVDELSGDFEVEAVSCGTEALRRLESTSYDAVISDLRMPDLSGVEVLEFSRRRQPDVVRILLTGHLDDDARRATLEHDAPYKIAKPWYDTLDVTLRRAFEHRAHRRRMSSVLTEAVRLGDIDDAFMDADGLVGIARILVERASAVPSISSVVVETEVGGCTQILGEFRRAPEHGPRTWAIEAALTNDGTTRVRGTGDGRDAREIFLVMVEHARRWSDQDPTTQLARRALKNPEARERLLAVSRQATVGAMAGSLMHEISSIIQVLQGTVGEMADFIRDQDAADADILEAAEAGIDSASRMVVLFNALRSFVRFGVRGRRRLRLDALVRQSATLCASYVRRKARLKVAKLPEALVEADEVLLTQVIVNLLRNAAEASPPAGVVEVNLILAGDRAHLRIRDSGPGVPIELQDRLFEPFQTTKEEGTGLGLAISAQIVQDHGGAIRYEPSPGGGATFVVSLPLAIVADDRNVEDVPFSEEPGRASR